MLKAVRLIGLRPAWILLLSFGMLTGCFSQVSAPKAVVDINPVEKAFLWKIKKGPQRSFLFGTIHLGIDAERELPKEVWDAFNQANCFVMEANPSDISMTEVARFAYLPSGQKLSDLLKPEVYERLKNKLNGAMPESILQRSQPWFVSLLLLRTGQTDVLSMDAAMLARAKQSGKKIFFLEDWRDAMKDYADMTTADDLAEMLQDEGTFEKDLSDLIAAYRSGEEDKIAAILDRVYSHSASGREKLHRLIDERNRKWLPHLQEALESGTCFVAVGTGHYVGPASLRTLLDQKGWLVL